MIYFFRSIFLILIATVWWHIIAVAFGAPFLQSFRETLAFSSILSLCSTVPCLIVFRNWEDFIRVFFDFHIERNSELVVYYAAFGSIFGAWLGAFPIPLDWDRSWQKWPITCVVGTVLGCFGSLFYSYFVIWARKRRGRKSKII